ncbi:MAG TPA: tRNA 2-thiouridine(34) synthase MnmA [Woeseiaceae bacterium]|nr:tRNA 2-thiouridine(34) synthase MnmA [Woeseiaceae bacterium]
MAGCKVILGISGGVDSAVAAVLLREAGARVEALHMTNWDDQDGYCTAAEDLQDARRVCSALDIPLHHVNFTKQYRERVFAFFLSEYQAGRTPNPDVLCNREIKFGEFRRYARRLGGDAIATGHYARTALLDERPALLKGKDSEKDQSYFLHAVTAEAIGESIFPIGDLEKSEVRDIARDYGLAVHDKKDSTGICFIGERPFREFLANFLPAQPGPIRTVQGELVGQHSGLMYYTLGQRKGLGIGGLAAAPEKPWYVVDKELRSNTLIIDQGDSLRLLSDTLLASDVNWIGPPPAGLQAGRALHAKIRYRQADQACEIQVQGNRELEVRFASLQRAVAPGQYVVFYDGDRCLGGASIDVSWLRASTVTDSETRSAAES